ncbi:MAG: ORF6N domain-containing protein [Desulfobacterales bacterium]
MNSFQFTRLTRLCLAHQDLQDGEDIKFELSKEEFKNLRSQIVASSWGGLRYSPMVFSEQGVVMFTPLNAQLI